MEILPALLGALPDLGALGGSLILLLVAFRWFAAERTAWREERAQLLAEAAAARAELRAISGGGGRHASDGLVP